MGFWSDLRTRLLGEAMARTRWLWPRAYTAWLRLEALEERLAPAVEPAFRGGLSVASADVDQDRVPDFISATGAGTAPRVTVYSGADGRPLALLQPFEDQFSGGLFVAAGDVTGDGLPEVVVGADAGGGPRVVVLNPVSGSVISTFFAYDASFSGGVRVAVGDIDGDGHGEIVTAPGVGGAAHIRIFDGMGRNLGRDYMAYDPTFRGGASVAVGDTDGDGIDDVITGAGPGGGPHVRVMSGRTWETLESYFAGIAGVGGGIWVATADVDGNGLADVVTGAGAGDTPLVRVFAGHGTLFAEWQAYESEFRGGVRVAASDLTGDAFADVVTGPGHGGGPRITIHDGYGFSRSRDFFAVTEGGPLGFGLAAPPLRTPLFDGRTLFVEGTDGTVDIAADLLHRFTEQAGEFGLYAVDDADGTVGGIRPGDANYPAAALASHTALFTPVVTTGTSVSFSLPRGRRYAAYFLPGGTPSTQLFSFPAANPAGIDVFRVGPRNRAAFDDVAAGDRDLNDALVGFRRVSEQTDLHTAPQVLPFVSLSAPSPLVVSPPVVVPPVVSPPVTSPPIIPPPVMPPPVVVTPPVVPPTVSFPSDLRGWVVSERGGTTSRGTALASGGQASLIEGDSFVTTLSRSFVVPTTPTTVQFTYSGLTFDTSATGVKDAFEAAILDETGHSLVPSFAAGRDAFFNVVDGGTVAIGGGVTVSGQTITVDLSAIPEGTTATLVFRLVNNDTDTGSTVSLASYALPASGGAQAPVKFYVADAASTGVYRYGVEGLTAGLFGLAVAESDPRGTASNAAGDTVWVVDRTSHNVTVYGAGGGVLGSWKATDVTTPEGVSVQNGDLWLVDRGTGTVRRYDGGAIRRSGAAVASFTFLLSAENTSPSDLVTDGGTVWVTDDARAEVFVYDVSGTLLGRWHLDPGNTAPSGITRNPAGGTALWVVDRATRQVFEYPLGESARTGQLIAAGTFDLGAGVTEPEGIADPPVVTLTTPATAKAGETLLLTGTTSDPAAVVMVNGRVVEALDVGGNFFTRETVHLGENRYEVTATSADGTTGTTAATVSGHTAGAIDWSEFTDVTASFRAEYGRTTYRVVDRTLAAEVAVRNVGTTPVVGRLYAAVTHLSDPDVRPLDPAGTLPDGTPYYDFTALIPDGKALAPDAVTGSIDIRFANPKRGRFTYDLVFYGQPNHAPVFTSVPPMEYLLNPYNNSRYTPTAVDPDGDPVTITVVTGSETSFIYPQTIQTVFRADDGRGGVAEQVYSGTIRLDPPNRPPIITSTPDPDVDVGNIFTYQVVASDPDVQPELANRSFALAPGAPAGMSIDFRGLITWPTDDRNFGHHPVTVVVTDAAGATATQTFEVCVEAPANHSPVIVSEPVTVARSSPSTASGNLLMNGGFEQGSNLTGGGWFSGNYLQIPETLDSGLGGLDGWEAQRVAVIGPAWAAASGQRSLELYDYGPQSFLRQTISTVPGRTYVVGFDLAGTPVTGTSRVGVTLTAGAQSGTFSFDTAGRTSTDMGWERHEWAFVADSAQTTIEFRPTRQTHDRVEFKPGPLLDNISLLPAVGYTYAVRALDPDGAQLRYSLLAAPAGMTISPQSGLITWNPSAGQVGSHPVTVRVDDGLGGSDEQSFVVSYAGPSNPARPFQPVVERRFADFASVPEARNTLATPAVVDWDLDGRPDIVVPMYRDSISLFGELGGYIVDGPTVLRIFRAADGVELMPAVLPGVDPSIPAAVGDLNGDGRPDAVVALRYGQLGENHLVAVANDGSVLWDGGVRVFVGGAPTLADLDGDGRPEVLVGATVLNGQTGAILWSAPGGSNGDYGPQSVVADLDLDGTPEVLAGNTAYRADGSVYWSASIGDGFTAVANFDADPFPEIVLSTAGQLYLLSHDGQVVWGPVAIPGGGRGGAPAVADLDGDGRPEILAAALSSLVAVSADGTILWRKEIYDPSSEAGMPTAFDFDADGRSEVVFAEGDRLWILDGPTGSVLYSTLRNSPTAAEYPVIADLDGDGSAEILVPNSDNLNSGPRLSGFTVIGDLYSNWTDARPIWNQYSYHVTNVTNDGTIPSTEANSWQGLNTYRVQQATGTPTRGDADLTVLHVDMTAGIVSAVVQNEVGSVPAGIVVAFYDGDPARGGRRLGSVATPAPTGIGRTATVSFTLPGLVNDLWVRVDDTDLLFEADERNNTQRAGVDTDPVNYAPVFRTVAPVGATAMGLSPFRYPARAIDPDGDTISYDLPLAPAGMLVDAWLGTIAWVPARNQVGTHTVVLRATDAAGNVALQSFTVTVTPPNIAPVITSVSPAGPAAVGHPFHYALSAQDADGDALSYRLVGAQAGMAISLQGVLTWTPQSGDVGSRSVTVVVEDGRGGTAQQQVTIDVAAAPTNTAPTIRIEAATEAWLGRRYVGRVVAADGDGDPLTFTLVAAPTGMTIDASGIISWQPAGSGGPVEVRVTDGRGGVVSASFTISVTASETNHAPVVVSTPSPNALKGVPYTYDLTAVDEDGDPVAWELVTGPQGASLDPVLGTLRWLPGPDQTGEVTFTVRARDPKSASGEQTFTVAVSCADAPPTITSRAPSEGYVGYPLLYGVRATDPEGGPLTFSLDVAPAGMAFLPGTGILQWTPTSTGPAAVTLRVTDRAGNSATQSFTVEVGAGAPNHLPAITSRPDTRAIAGRTYSYQVTAVDADGDPITYSITYGSISASGLITFTPPEVGAYLVTAGVSDGHGGIGYQQFTITARANTAPALTAIPDGIVPVGGTFRTGVRATDPEGDRLTFRLDAGPAGMTMDAEGRITWTAIGAPRTETVTVTATDPDGLSATTSFTLTVTADTQAPRVTIGLSRQTTNTGTPVTVSVRVTDNVTATAVSLAVRHGGVTTPLALDASGQATFIPTDVGRYTLLATAIDPSGNIGESSVELRGTDPADTTGPNVAITRLRQLLPGGGFKDFNPEAEVASVTYLTDLYGTIHDPDGLLDHWAVLVAPTDVADVDNVDPSAPYWQTVATGTNEVTDGKLGTFDPTLLVNGRYAVAVVAYDAGGHGSVRGVEIDVTGNAKLGEFHLEFTDLNLPFNGVPITVTRVYDSREANTSGDFGYGWRLGVADARIRETVSATAIDIFSSAAPFRANTKVYLTNPAGERVGFTFRPEARANWLGSYFVPKFVADPGVTDTLEVDPVVLQQFADGTFGLFQFGVSYNPDDYTLTTKDGLKYEYNQFSGLRKITDRNDNFVTFAEDGITHSGGDHISFVRDGQGRISSVIDPNGNAIGYAYDAKGDLRAVTDQENQTTRFTYRSDRAHYLDEVYDPLNRRAVKTEYDAAGRVVAVTDALGNRAQQSFDPLNFTETVRDARGNSTAITYNDRGNVVRSEQPTEFGPIITQYEYTDPNNPDKETRVVNPRGFATTRTYDSRGNLVSQTTPDGTTAYTYSADNKVLSVADPRNGITTYSYSPQGNLVRIVNTLRDSATFTYDPLGRVATFTDFAGNMTTFSDYCDCGRPGTITNPDGTVRHVETNEFTQVTKTIDERGNVTENVYDDVGRLIRVIDGEGHATEYEYEIGTANVVLVRDPLGNVTRYAYDAAGRRIRIIDAEGGITSFTYDRKGNLETVTDPVNNVTRFVYDAANRVKEEVDPLGVSKFFAYDAAGNRIEVIDRNGRRRTFTYDAMNRLTHELWWSGNTTLRDIASTYDTAGNLILTSHPDATLTYTYDAMNRVRTATTVYSGTVIPATTLTYAYDKNGNITSVVDDDGVRIDSSYDSRNRLASQVWSGGGVGPEWSTYDYYANGELKSIVWYYNREANVRALVTSYDYWKNGLTKSIDRFTGGVGTVPIGGYSYQYDAAGRLTEETHHGDTYAYGYDRTGQLTSVQRNGTLTESFSYDANGNRRTSTGPNGNQTYATAGAGNRLLNDGLFRYTYDGEGNLKTKTEIATGTVTEYTWDFRNRLIKVEERTAGGIILSVSEYAYDPTGRRILQKTNGNALYTIYDRAHAWVDRNGTGAVTARYIYGDRIDQILARWTPDAGTAWYLTDKLGTVRDMFAAEIINHVDYLAFGQILTQTNPAAGDRFTFTGREWDAAIGDYYYRARWYDPTAGRFTGVDPIGFGGRDANMYRYVNNLPIQFVDPTGKVAAVSYLRALGESGTIKFPGAGNANEITGGIVGYVHGYSIGALLFTSEFISSGEWEESIKRAKDGVTIILDILGYIAEGVEESSNNGFIAGGFVKGYFNGFKFDLLKLEFGLDPDGPVFKIAAKILKDQFGIKLKWDFSPTYVEEFGFEAGANAFFSSI